MKNMSRQEYNQLSSKIIGSVIEEHRTLGMGLMESVYEKALVYEMQSNGLQTQQQVSLTIHYKDLRIDNSFFADIIIDKKIILEIKAREIILPVHKAQLLSYLRLTGMKLGLLINFHEEKLKDGITRLINGNLDLI